MNTAACAPRRDCLYTVIHGRDGLHAGFPQFVSDDDENNVADEMHRITKGTNLGWPYTYYDGLRRLRLLAPEYGGDGKQTAKEGEYSKPVLTFQSRRAAPVDLVFYTGQKFPASYRGAAFIVLHGTRTNGYNLVFVPLITMVQPVWRRSLRMVSLLSTRPAKHRDGRNTGLSAQPWERMELSTWRIGKSAESGALRMAKNEKKRTDSASLLISGRKEQEYWRRVPGPGT
jgi:glucose/arabinose dehydrogenase